MIPRRAPVLFLLVLAVAARVSAAEPTHAPPATAGATPEPAATATAPLVDTVVESEELDMVSTAKETTFTYRRNVRVTATNMTLTCDELVIIARRSGDPTALLGKQEKLKSLVATGHVRIVQSDREATAERAEVFPDEDKVVLFGDPVVRSPKDGWEQRGERMELYRGERRAVIPSKPRTILPPLKDLGYDKVPEKKKTPADPTQKADGPASVTVPLPPPKP